MQGANPFPGLFGVQDFQQDEKKIYKPKRPADPAAAGPSKAKRHQERFQYV